MWSLQVNDSPISYMFGTMHVQDARAFAFANRAKECIDLCEEFYSEIRFDAMVEEMMISAQRMPEGQTIRSLLGEKKFAKAEKIIDKVFNVSLIAINELLPIVVINHLVMQSLVADQAEHLDMTLFMYAKQKEKSTKGLETVMEHVSVLKSISLELQRKQLLDLVRQPQKYKRKVIKLAEVYASGDIYSLYKSSKKSMGELKSLMIYDRNALMAKRIMKNVETSAFYAFGAAHLAGKRGILKILKNNGFKVQPILG